MGTRQSTNQVNLEYVKTIGIVSDGVGGRGFAHPYDMAIAQDGRMFVLSRAFFVIAQGIRVGICNLDEEYFGEFGYGSGPGDGQLVLPVAMAFDSQERLYITDEYNHRITILDKSGTFLDKWGDYGSGDGELNGPAGIAIDPDDNVYIADQHNNRVQKFTAGGSYLTQWGEAGAAHGQFNLPWGVALDSKGDVYVADWRNDRIQKFTADGRFLASFGEPGEGDGQFNRPSGVAVDPQGNIYVADWGNERVQVLGPDGGFQLKLRGQATLSRWAEEFYASNPDEKRERDRSNLFPPLPDNFSTPNHLSGAHEALFWGPVSVKLDPQGRLYVIESNRGRFQVYQKT